MVAKVGELIEGTFVALLKDKLKEQGRTEGDLEETQNV